MLDTTSSISRTLSIVACAIFALGMPQVATAQSGKQSRECTIEDVAIYENRVVIQCDVRGGKKSPAKYYAVAVTSPTATMVLQLGLTSLRRKVKIYFIDDTSLNPPGCEPIDCRRLEGIVAIER